MKTIAFIVGFLILSLGGSSQSIMDKLFDKYSGATGFTSVYISKYMFDMFRNKDADPKTQDEMQQTLSKLNCIKILATDDDPATNTSVDLYQEILKVLPGSSYKEIMVVKDKDQNVVFYAKEEKDRVAELLLVVGGKDSNVLISIQGDIDMKNISKLGSTMNIQGMDKLKDMKEK
jgi:hypothetical protein